MRDDRATTEPPQLARGTRPLAVLTTTEPSASTRATPGLVVDLARAIVPEILHRLGRRDLEWFVNVCLHLSGEPTRCTFAGLTDDELRLMALRLRRRLGDDG